MKIGLKLAVAFFFVACISMLVISIISYIRGKKSLEEEAFNKLIAVREIKAAQIEDYFQLISDQIQSFSEDPTIIQAMKDFKKGYELAPQEVINNSEYLNTVQKDLEKYYKKGFYKRLRPNLEPGEEIIENIPKNINTQVLQYLYISDNPYNIGEKHLYSKSNDNSTYSTFHKRYHPFIASYREKFGYYDMFLIDDKTGSVVYSVFKEVDFATSLLDGPFKETNLANAFKAAKDEKEIQTVRWADFKSYAPSYNNHAAFAATAIFDKGEKIGVLAFQLPVDRINAIMTNKQLWADVGLGNTGETYIVGEDYTLRNQSRFLIEDRDNYISMIRKMGMSEKVINKIKNFNSSIGIQTVKTEGTKEALAGIKDEKTILDYRGVPVLSSYKPLNIPEMKWVIMSEIDEAEAFTAIQVLRNYMQLAFAILILIIMILSFVISRELTKPIEVLNYDAKELMDGNYDVQISINRKDEIGVLANSFRKMQSSIKNHIQELQHINKNLENIVEERTLEIKSQKHVVEQKNKEIVDSINYARNIQKALIGTGDDKLQLFKDVFVFYEPKDIVSGDFFKINQSSKLKTIIVGDCTGHGVPGAFMTILGKNFLEEIINFDENTSPQRMLIQLDKRVSKILGDSGLNDGMDVGVLCIDEKLKIAYFSGANQTLYYVHNNEITEIKGSKFPIGSSSHFESKRFELVEIPYTSPSYFYLTTDGIIDQFGGTANKKYTRKRFKEFILRNHLLALEQQRINLKKEFREWRGANEQTDDVCVIGVVV